MGVCDSKPKLLDALPDHQRSTRAMIPEVLENAMFYVRTMENLSRLCNMTEAKAAPIFAHATHELKIRLQEAAALNDFNGNMLKITDAFSVLDYSLHHKPMECTKLPPPSWYAFHRQLINSVKKCTSEFGFRSCVEILFGHFDSYPFWIMCELLRDYPQIWKLRIDACGETIFDTKGKLNVFQTAKDEARHLYESEVFSLTTYECILHDLEQSQRAERKRELRHIKRRLADSFLSMTRIDVVYFNIHDTSEQNSFEQSSFEQKSCDNRKRSIEAFCDIADEDVWNWEFPVQTFDRPRRKHLCTLRVAFMHQHRQSIDKAFMLARRAFLRAAVHQLYPLLKRDREMAMLLKMSPELQKMFEDDETRINDHWRLVFVQLKHMLNTPDVANIVLGCIGNFHI